MVTNFIHAAVFVALYKNIYFCIANTSYALNFVLLENTQMKVVVVFFFSSPRVIFKGHVFSLQLRPSRAEPTGAA